MLVVLVVQSCPTLCDPMDYTVHGILQIRILEQVAFPISRGSSQTRDQTQVSHIVDGFFTSWATREAQEYWSGSPIPSPVDLPNPGIQLGSPSLQADSLPTELWRNPRWSIRRENDIILELILLLIKCIERFPYAKHPAKDHPQIISFDPQNNSVR